ncbi:MAG TPA: aspartate aminotransferase family protein [Microscillaceae bacterium]|nr:aspartate aminotransferase family protein [Microscillaceae bacterium]
MNLFDVYPSFNVEPVKGEGPYIWDKNGKKYVDFYGGHAVMSIGHSHPHYVQKIESQLRQLGFYSNSTQNPLQEAFAQKLTQMSGYSDYRLFLCNTGAEANESAFTLASHQTGRRKILTFTKGFHGRTSAARSVTDLPKVASVNAQHEVAKIPLNDLYAVQKHLQTQEFAAVIIEGVQGFGGVYVPNSQFVEQLAQVCKATQTVLILDEIQSGYGRTGKFFAHQYTSIRPDVITMAKGMGNGFPIGGMLISPEFTPWKGMLGTTFGGNHLACVAGLAVLEIIAQENLMRNAEKVGQYLKQKLDTIAGIKEVRGKGLMIGLEFDFPVQALREQLLYEHQVFTGISGTHVLRILPPLTITPHDADWLVNALQSVLCQTVINY